MIMIYSILVGSLSNLLMPLSWIKNGSPTTVKLTVRERYILYLIDAYGLRTSAKSLGLSRTTLWRRLKEIRKALVLT